MEEEQKVQEESESVLAAQILDARDKNRSEGRKGQSPMMNLLVAILIVLGVAVLVALYFLYLKPK